MYKAFLIGSLLLVQSITFATSSHARLQNFNQWNGFPNTLNSDFFTTQSQSTSRKKRALPADCRAHIQNIVCLVDPMKEGEDSAARPCLADGENYALYFENIYDHAIPTLQKMFCSLSKIYIEKQFYGSAYAGTLHSPDGEISSVIIGVRKSILDQNLELQRWASWKEQLSFGGDASSAYNVSSDLPTIQTPSQLPINNFLYFAIVHEFGHIFDFANQVNQFTNCPDIDNKADSECAAVPDSWSSLSWKNYDETNSQNDFAKRANLCFYSCAQTTPLMAADVPLIYQGLANSNFISTYAATNPWDDFADSLGYFIVDQQLKSSYIIDTNQGERYDMIEKLHSEKFATKYNYLRDFLQRTNLQYP